MSVKLTNALDHTGYTVIEEAKPKSTKTRKIITKQDVKIFALAGVAGIAAIAATVGAIVTTKAIIEELND